MTSPIVDEEVMLELLKASAPEKLGENAVRLRTGAGMLLLDAFDRKVTRDQFIAAVGAAVELTDTLGRFEMMSNVKDFMEKTGRVSHADIEVTAASLISKASYHTDQCAKMAELVHQCPLTEDKIH